MLEKTDEIILTTAQALGLAIKQFHPEVASFHLTHTDSKKSFIASHWSIYPCQKQWHAGLMRYKDLCAYFLSSKGFKTIPGKYVHNAQYTSVQLTQLLENTINQSYGYPCVIKQNDGSQSKNVFICNSPTDLITAIPVIHEHIENILIQPYVQGQEYRLFVYKGEIQFLYEKQFVPFNQKTDRLTESPLSKDTFLTTDFPDYLSDFTKKIFSGLDAQVMGIDIFLNNDIFTKQEMTIIEMNHNPGLSVPYHTYGEKEFVIDLLSKIYEDCIKS